MMLHFSYQLRNVQLDACWKTQNCFQMIDSQLIASAAFVQFQLRESLFTAVGDTKHAGVKKCIVFPIDKCVGQSFVEVKQTSCFPCKWRSSSDSWSSASCSWHSAGNSSTDTPGGSVKSFIDNPLSSKFWNRELKEWIKASTVSC